MSASERDLHLRQIISALANPVQFAGFDGASDSKLVVFTSDLNGRKSMEKELRDNLKAEGLDIRPVVKSVAADRLHKARDLKGFSGIYGSVRAVYDPTGCITRARALVDAGEALREVLKDKVVGLYFHGWKRVLFVQLDPQAYIQDKKVVVGDLRDAENAVAKALRDALGDDVEEVVRRVRMTFTPPKVPVVALDAMSLPRKKGMMKRILQSSVAAAAIAFVGFGANNAAKAEDGDAVSDTNAKISVQGGEVDGFGSGMVLGSLSIPIFDFLGVQADGMGAVINDDVLWGFGGHIFWRDPETALVGITGSHSEIEEYEMHRLGGEVEIYLGQVSLLGQAGYQFGDVEESVYGELNLDWYVDENLLLSGGGEYSEELWFGQATIEWQPAYESVPGLTLFLDGEYGEDDYNSLQAGIRFYFGTGTKSLVDRHRQDDPGNLLDDVWLPLKHARDEDKPAYAGGGGGMP